MAVRPVVLAGPTAIGKSGVALALAEAYRGEIVCADSRQIYEGMRIGSAAPSDEDRARVPHHGYNVVPPEETYDAGRFLDDTDAYAAEIAAREGRPLLVGGSGLYLRAWRYGLSDVPGTDAGIRARLLEEAAQLGSPALHARLAAIDEETAARVSPNDQVRVVRALEVHALTGDKPSARRVSHGGAAPRVQATWILLDAELAWLTPRIERRAQQMFGSGLVEEALALEARLGADHPLLDTMGYREARQLARGALGREEAIARAARRQRQYARRQRTWFKKEPWWTRVDPAREDPLAACRALLGAPEAA